MKRLIAWERRGAWGRVIDPEQLISASLTERGQSRKRLCQARTTEQDFTAEAPEWEPQS